MSSLDLSTTPHGAWPGVKTPIVRRRSCAALARAFAPCPDPCTVGWQNRFARRIALQLLVWFRDPISRHRSSRPPKGLCLRKDGVSLSEIAVNNLRCVEHAEPALHPGHNLIWGENGSGKTSLLEAIFLLGRGRSFRSATLNALFAMAKCVCACSAGQRAQPTP